MGKKRGIDGYFMMISWRLMGMHEVSPTKNSNHWPCQEPIYWKYLPVVFSLFVGAKFGEIPTNMVLKDVF